MGLFLRPIFETESPQTSFKISRETWLQQQLHKMQTTFGSYGRKLCAGDTQGNRVPVIDLKADGESEPWPISATWIWFAEFDPLVWKATSCWSGPRRWVAFLNILSAFEQLWERVLYLFKKLIVSLELLLSLSLLMLQFFCTRKQYIHILYDIIYFLNILIFYMFCVIIMIFSLVRFYKELTDHCLSYNLSLLVSKGVLVGWWRAREGICRELATYDWFIKMSIFLLIRLDHYQ